MRGKKDILARWAKAFDTDTATLERRACGGKWKGTTDYILRINGSNIAVGNSCFGQEALQDFLDCVVTTYETFQKIKHSILDKLRDYKPLDDALADKIGANHYKVIDVDFCKKGDFIGWFYVTLDINGRKINHLDTRINQDIKDFIKGCSFSPQHRDYYTAGGLDDSDVDYVFHSVGFSSTKEMYKAK